MEKLICDRCAKEITSQSKFKIRRVTNRFVISSDMERIDLCPDCSEELDRWLSYLGVYEPGRK